MNPLKPSTSQQPLAYTETGPIKNQNSGGVDQPNHSTGIKHTNSMGSISSCKTSIISINSTFSNEHLPVVNNTDHHIKTGTTPISATQSIQEADLETIDLTNDLDYSLDQWKNECSIDPNLPPLNEDKKQEFLNVTNRLNASLNKIEGMQSREAQRKRKADGPPSDEIETVPTTPLFQLAKTFRDINRYHDTLTKKFDGNFRAMVSSHVTVANQKMNLIGMPVETRIKHVLPSDNDTPNGQHPSVTLR